MFKLSRVILHLHLYDARKSARIIMLKYSTCWIVPQFARNICLCSLYADRAYLLARGTILLACNLPACVCLDPTV